MTTVRLRHRLAVAVLGVVVLVGVAPVAGATAKPVGDLVPTNLNELRWTYPLPVGSGSLTVRNATVVNKVRALINGLPAWHKPNEICPADVRRPYTVSFLSRTSPVVVTKVVFQLGGCPSAQVYQHGHAITPTLGGPTLTSTFNKIATLIIRSFPASMTHFGS